MKFAMSYSCGKDSTLALHKMVEQGHEPVCLVIVVNKDQERSYFHGADYNMMNRYAQALELPVILCPTAGETYHLALEEGLQKARKMGAEAACFGDIDIEENRKWEEDRCAAVGLTPFFPLWQRGREENVKELIALRYRCLIKSINQTLLPRELLGTYLDSHSAEVIKAAGVDVCGENGEYHTLAVDGPVFHKTLVFRIGEVLEFGDYAVVDVR